MRPVALPGLRLVPAGIWPLGDPVTTGLGVATYKGQISYGGPERARAV